jgi:hypothetical protein
MAVAVVGIEALGGEDAHETIVAAISAVLNTPITLILTNRASSVRSSPYRVGDIRRCGVVTNAKRCAAGVPTNAPCARGCGLLVDRRLSLARRATNPGCGHRRALSPIPRL